MKLIVQSDDYGFTRGITWATHDAMRNGIITSTGLFANMPAAREAVEMAADCPGVCLGIDINIVSGRPCADPAAIPDLVEESGDFIRSTARRKDPRWGKEDLYPYDQVCTETEAQIRRFMALTGGRKPEYIHGHAIGESSANYRRALHDVGLRFGIPFTRDIWKQYGIGRHSHYTQGPFGFQEQAQCDCEANTLALLEQVKGEAYVRLGGHCGFVDAELLKHSTFSIIRCKDYVMYTSPRIKQWISDNGVELISYADLPIL